MNFKSVLLGVLSGIAAGAILGVLFAPEKGSKTRKEISKKGEDFIKGLKEKFNDLRETPAENYEDVKEKASELAEKQGKSKSKKKD